MPSDIFRPVGEATLGPYRPPAETPAPGLGATLGAAFRQDNILMSVAANQLSGIDNNVEDGFNAWNEIAGNEKYERHWALFARANNRRYAAAIKAQIDMEEDDRRTLAAAGVPGMIASLAAGIIDPTILLPGGALVKSGSLGYSVSRSALSVGLAAAGGVAVQEAFLQGSQETRSLGESAMNVGGGVVLGALLGGAAARFLSPAERAAALRAADTMARGSETFGDVPPSRGGMITQGLSAEAAEKPTVDQLGVAGTAASALAKVSSFLSPQMRMAQNPSAAAQRVFQELNEISYHTNLNREGKTLGPAVETLMRQEVEPRLGQAYVDSKNIYEEMTKAGTNMDWRAFNEAVAFAARRGDTAVDGNEYVSRAAQMWRSRVIEPFKQRAIDAGLLPEGVSIDTAASYLTRMWDREIIIAKELEAKDRFTTFFESMMKQQYAEQSETLARRLAANEQQLADMRLSPEERVRVLQELDAKMDRLDAENADLVDALDEIRTLNRTAKDAPAAAAQAEQEIARIRAAHGERLTAFQAATREIQSRRRSVQLGYASTAEKAERTLEAIARLEDSNVRSMQTLIRKGQQLQREMTRLSPDKIEDRLNSLYEQYFRLSDAAEKQALRAEDTLKKYTEDAAKAAAKPQVDELKRAARENITARTEEIRADAKQTADDKIAAFRDEQNELAREAIEAARERAARIRAAVSTFDPASGPGAVGAARRQERGFAQQGRELAAEIAKIRADAKTRIASETTRLRAEAQSAANEKIAAFKDKIETKLASDLEALDSPTLPRQAVDKMTEMLEREAKHQRERADRLSGVAQRIKDAEDFDLEARMDAVKMGADLLAREVSARSLNRGAKYSRLQNRLSDLAPEKVDARVAELQQRAATMRSKFNEKWGTKLDVGAGAGPEPSFKEFASDAAQETLDKILGRHGDTGFAHEFQPALERGPLKDRVFPIPDELVEDLLVNDMRHLMDRYARVIAADSSIANKFGGRPDMADAFKEIRAEFQQLREDTRSLPQAQREKKLKELNDAEKQAMADITATRDIIRGTYSTAAFASNFGRASRALTNVNYILRSGGMALSSLSEFFRSATVHGLVPYFKGAILPLLTNLDAIRLSTKEIKLAGLGYERATLHRLFSVGEIGDPYAKGSAIERVLEQGTRIASKWNFLPLVTDMQHMLSGVASQNRILELIEKSVEGKKVSQKEISLLRYLGINETQAGEIYRLSKQHGEIYDSVRVAGTEMWDNPIAVQTFRAALNKDVHTTITRPGAADLPLFARTPLGRLLFQFQSFAIAGHQRVTLRGLQEDQARFLGGTIAFASFGMAIAYLKSLRQGEEAHQRFMENARSNPFFLIAEGYDNANLTPLMMNVANTMGRVSQGVVPGGFNPIKTPIRALGGSTAQESVRGNYVDIWGALLGPTGGLASDAVKAAGALGAVATGETPKESQMNASMRLIPFGAHLGMREGLQVLYGDSPFVRTR